LTLPVSTSEAPCLVGPSKSPTSNYYPGRFIALDDIARATGSSTARLLDAAEVHALESLDDGL
jgi:hypothetical protein